MCANISLHAASELELRLAYQTIPALRHYVFNPLPMFHTNIFVFTQTGCVYCILLKMQMVPKRILFGWSILVIRSFAKRKDVTRTRHEDSILGSLLVFCNYEPLFTLTVVKLRMSYLVWKPSKFKIMILFSAKEKIIFFFKFCKI